MTTLRELIPDPEMVLALEPEELAGVARELLESAAPNEPSRMHPSSFTSDQTIGKYEPRFQEPIRFALAEGWHWLVQEGLIAPIPGDTAGWHFLTRRGQKLRNRDEIAAFRNASILPKALLHPAIAKECWSAFLRGNYDTSVFQAFKELEVSIREAGKYRAEEFGVTMARRAFDPSNGPLTETTSPTSEREALMHLVGGAIGSYKNPHSHRKVKLSPEEAMEMILLASHLLKIVDSRSKARTQAT